MKYFIFTFLAIFILTNCSSESSEKNQNVKSNDDTKINNKKIEESKFESESEVYNEEYNEEIITPSEGKNEIFEFKGYIGKSPIVLNIMVDEQQKVSGSYFYEKYNKEIELQGVLVLCNDCGGEGTSCDHLLLHEYIDNKKGAQWYFDCFDSQCYNYPKLYHSIEGVWEDELTSHYMALISKESTEYLEPNSKLLFNSKTEANTFFSKHKIHNNEIENKRFYIFANDPAKQYDQPLPNGIELNIFEGDISTYYLNENGKFENDYNSFPISELSSKKLTNEIFTYVFEGFNKYNVYANTSYISLEQLENFGYYIQDEHSWLISNSGNVMGYFPESGKINFYQKPNINSKIIFKEAKESLGFIKIVNIELHNLEYWAKVKFEYYTNVPCSEEIRESKPSVEGWIKLYDNNNNLTIRHTPGGC